MLSSLPPSDSAPVSAASVRGLYSAEAQPIPQRTRQLLWTMLLVGNGLYWLLFWPSASWLVFGLDMALTCAAYWALFALNWYVLVPDYLARGKRMGYLALVVPAFVATFIVRTSCNSALNISIRLTPKEITRVSDSAAYQMGYTYGRTLRRSGGEVAVTTLLVLLLSLYTRMSADYEQARRLRQEQDRRREELEKQHLAAELALLKAQINPHFLFNTLNNIYSLTSQESANAPAAVAVLQLAELMRYLLYESAADTVPLSREVMHLRSFLSLQQLRLPGAGPEALRFVVEADQPDAFPVAPMLLLPLVENAFKHGDMAARPYVVEMLLLVQNGQLTFTVRNALRPDAGRRPAGPGGVGLVNLRRRLELLYPGQHTLNWHEAEAHYHIALTLRIDS